MGLGRLGLGSGLGGDYERGMCFACGGGKWSAMLIGTEPLVLVSLVVGSRCLDVYPVIAQFILDVDLHINKLRIPLPTPIKLWRKIHIPQRPLHQRYFNASRLFPICVIIAFISAFAF